MATDDTKCNLYHKTDQGGNSSIFHIQNPYGGIPQNLLTNLIGVGILLALFFIMRKSAWKVIDQLVPKNDMDRWTHIFFSFSNAMSNLGNVRNSQIKEDIHVIDPSEFEEGQIVEDAGDTVKFEENQDHKSIQFLSCFVLITVKIPRKL